MATKTMQSTSTYICRTCTQAAKSRSSLRPVSVQFASYAQSRTTSFSRPRRNARYSTTIAIPASAKATAQQKDKAEPGFYENQWTIFSASNEALVRKAQEFGDRILQSKGIPSEAEALNALQVIDSAARQLVFDAKGPTSKRDKAANPTQSGTSALLSLGGSATRPDTQSSDANPMSISISVDLLSKLAYKIATHPAVFINPSILATYISLQSTLHRPASFPEIFSLYASKPSARQGPNNTIQYKSVNPDAASQAVPAVVANEALNAAIATRDLLLALDIIQSTYATPSFRRSKFIRLALPPITLLSLAPFAAYLAAQNLATQVLNIDPTQFTMVTVAGATTYVGVISTLAFVTISTANDQMERVTWAQGTPLRERWMREDERAAVDRLAVAWGFKSLERRGEEVGEEWDALREWCGVRNMELDRTDLMEGME